MQFVRRTTSAVTKGTGQRTIFERSKVPEAINEKILNYRKGSSERDLLEKTLKEMRKTQHDIPLIIGGEEVRTGNTEKIRIPHEHQTVLGVYHKAGEKEVARAIEASKKASKEWAAMSPNHRAAIFLKLADLLAGPYRQVLNAATILGQSKNFYQAEIDAACELIDFWRFNVKFTEQMANEQPISSPGVWNRSQYRPLEGFVYCISPFNFTAIGGNLVSSPAIMGNVQMWKPSPHAMLSAHYIMNLYREAGIPDGVVNFIPGDPVKISEQLISNPNFAGLHYTGSTQVFNKLWLDISKNIPNYRGYPRIVGETGGKDFIFAHPSAHINGLVTAMIRGAFEYAGQKCSAASRAYIPNSIWPKVKAHLLQSLNQIKMGNPEDHTVFVNAVIHEASADKAQSYIKYAQESNDSQILFGGKVQKEKGWFVEPTVVVATDPNHKLMTEEIFAPILTVFVYDDAKYEETLQLCDATSNYSLTGAFWAQDRKAIEHAEKALLHASGNFYINDKPTGAVVGQQPFGGSRVSGTNDKAGSMLNLLRWTTARSIKETFVPATDPLYPYMTD